MCQPGTLLVIQNRLYVRVPGRLLLVLGQLVAGRRRSDLHLYLQCSVQLRIQVAPDKQVTPDRQHRDDRAEDGREVQGETGANREIHRKLYSLSCFRTSPTAILILGKRRSFQIDWRS